MGTARQAGELPYDVVVASRAPRSGLTVYRPIAGTAPTELDFTAPSHGDGVPPLFSSAIAAWLRADQAAARARGGLLVARLVLRRAMPVHVALTCRAGEGHVELWGAPRALLAAVVGLEGEHGGDRGWP